MWADPSVLHHFNSRAFPLLTGCVACIADTNESSSLFPRPPITDHRLLITDYRLPITDYRLPMSDASGHFASFPFHWRVVVAVLKNLYHILHQKIVHA